MPLAFDAASQGGSGVNSSASATHTVTGANVVLVLEATMSAGTSLTSADYAGAAFVKLLNKDDGINQNVTMWYLVNPATGANTLNVKASAAGVSFCAASYTGANQSTNPFSLSTGATGNSNKPTLAIANSPSSEWYITAPGSGTGVASTFNVFDNVTARSQLFQSGTWLSGIGDTPGSGLSTSAWTMNAATAWSMVGASLMGTSAGAGATTIVPPSFALLGVGV